jgi:F0F1-type ATP synthase gamma subunit
MQQITKAMKVVYAAKLKKAQASVIAARPYAKKSRKSGASCRKHPGVFSSPSGRAGCKKDWLVVITETGVFAEVITPI